MDVPPKSRWKVTASSGDPRLAIDDNYATTWILRPSKKPWLEIDLSEVTTLGGLEVYWGKQAARSYVLEFLWMAKLGPNFVALTMAKVGKTSLHSRRPRPDSCGGRATIRNRSLDLRLSKLIFTVPPTPRRSGKMVVLRRSAMPRLLCPRVRA